MSTSSRRSSSTHTPGAESRLIREAFSRGGELARAIPEFELRPQQRRMALSIWDALLKPNHLLVEAGTGIGKSLAYLLPAGLWALKEGKRVVVSTYTKVLQSQLIEKEIPILRRVLERPLKAAVVYGQENYLCRRRLRASLFEDPELESLRRWADSGSGVLEEYPGWLSPDLRELVARDGESCLGSRCPHRASCFYYAAQREWDEADLLITNHYRFFAGLCYQNLPEFYGVIFDEAHKLEEAAARYFGFELDFPRLDRILSRLYSPPNSGLLPRISMGRASRNRLYGRLTELRELGAELFTGLEGRLGMLTRLRITAPIPNQLDHPLSRLICELGELAPSDDELKQDLAGLMRRLERYRLELNLGLKADDPGRVCWLERTRSGVGLNSALVAVAPVLKSQVFGAIPCCILTSATLSVADDFSFFSSRVGVDGAEELRLPAGFDYQRQALLYVALDLPLPADEAHYYDSCAQRIWQLLKLSRGRALVLFTSYKALKEVYERCPKDEARILVQGEMGRPELLRIFTEDVGSVLFATGSFWQGVDVPGEALSCLIITRLPFDVPDEPRLEAILDGYRDQGRDPFREYQLPQAVLRLRQGFGRLIRSRQDRGVICVLDPRLLRRGYGQTFIRSLPRIKLVQSLDAVAQFFTDEI